MISILVNDKFCLLFVCAVLTGFSEHSTFPSYPLHIRYIGTTSYYSINRNLRNWYPNSLPIMTLITCSHLTVNSLKCCAINVVFFYFLFFIEMLLSSYNSQCYSGVAETLVIMLIVTASAASSGDRESWWLLQISFLQPASACYFCARHLESTWVLLWVLWWVVYIECVGPSNVRVLVITNTQ